MKLYKKNITISADDLKDVCTLYEPSRAAGERGRTITTYTSRGAVNCQFTPNRGSRALQEAQLTYNEVATIRIRYNYDYPGINADWQVEFNGKRYTVHSVEDMYNRHQYLELLAYTKAD